VLDTRPAVRQGPQKGSWAGHINWWLLLIGPAAVAVSIVYSRINPEGFQRLQNQVESPSPYIVAFAAAIYAVRAACTRNALYILMTALGAAFTLREFHFDWTHEGIYVMLGGLGVWTYLWRRRLVEPLRDWRHTSWLIATFGAYFLSQLIARRAFRGIPGEHEIHRSLEECAELAAHLMLIITSLVGNWRKR